LGRPFPRSFRSRIGGPWRLCHSGAPRETHRASTLLSWFLIQFLLFTLHQRDSALIRFTLQGRLATCVLIGVRTRKLPVDHLVCVWRAAVSSFGCRVVVVLPPAQTLPPRLGIPAWSWSNRGASPLCYPVLRRWLMTVRVRWYWRPFVAR